MSTFRDVYNAIKTEVATLFPSKIEIYDAYDLENNPKQLLKDGFGVKIGSASTSEKTFDYMLTTNREFSIVLVREIFEISNNNASFNEQSSSIMDDRELLINKLLNLDRLADMKESELIEFLSDTGIETVKQDKNRFIFIEISFGIELTQLINR